jgi:DNA-binding transcriptional ArsR family regulator
MADGSQKVRPEPVILRDPKAIKALAHPARLAVLEEFMAKRELTATECASIAGLSPSAMSYHLRSLAKWGIITPTDSADGRERRWKLVDGGFYLEPDQPIASAAASATLVARILDRQRADVLTFFNNQASETPAWQEAITVSTSTYWLTAQEAMALGQAMMDTVDEYQNRSEHDRPAGSRALHLGIVVVPERGHLKPVDEPASDNGVYDHGQTEIGRVDAP